jgi:hypothetical protein
MRLFITSLLLIAATLNLWAVKPKPVENAAQKKALTSARALRDDLVNLQASPSRDSAVRYVNVLIANAKTIEDEQQLNYMGKYLLGARVALKNSSGQEQREVLSIINKNLSFRADAAGFQLDTLSMGWNASEEFFTEQQVKVKAFVKGSSTFTEHYTLNWANYYGGDITKYIKKATAEGSSDTFNNPYQVSVKLPALIVFWLKDSQGNLYKPNDWKEMHKGGPIELDFTLIKN